MLSSRVSVIQVVCIRENILLHYIRVFSYAYCNKTVSASEKKLYLEKYLLHICLVSIIMKIFINQFQSMRSVSTMTTFYDSEIVEPLRNLDTMSMP